MAVVGLLLAGMMVPLVIDYFSPAVQSIRREIPGAAIASVAPTPEAVGAPVVIGDVLVVPGLPVVGIPTNWWQRSEAAKAALRVLLKDGTVSLETGAMRDELDSHDLAFIPADRSDSCHQVCATAQHPNASRREEKGPAMICRVGWFNAINHCPVMLAAFPEAEGCETHYYGRDLPALALGLGGVGSGKALINSKPEEYPSGCEATGDHSRRLCGCKTRAADTTETLHDRVSRTVVRQITELMADLESGRRKAGRLNEWFATHRPQDIIDDVQARRVTFLEAHQGQSCFDACENAELACQMHWFELLNNCDALRAGFPFGADHCSENFYGRDLPAFRPEDATLLVNQKPRVYAASCGGKHSKTRRLCGCGFRKGGSTSSRTFHTVYNVQPSRYFEWQVRYMHLWFKQADMPGRITRLLTANAADQLSAMIPTHVSPPPRNPKDPGYSPYNKPSAVEHWLRNAKPTEDVILVIDPDCMFVSKMHIVVEEGSPIAQQAFYNFDLDSDEVPMQIARRYCKNCTFLDPIAVPMIVHRRDLLKIAPLWLSKTMEIRNDRHNWPNCWDNRTCSTVGLGWTAEMFGYVFAASELGIRHEIWDLQVVPPVHKEVITSIIHYHVEVPLSDGRQWYKHSDDACCNIPWPLPEATDNVTRTVITKLHEAHELLGEYNHTWPEPHVNKYLPETR